MLELIDVTKTVGGEAHVAGVTMTLAKGTLNVLLGPTLSGKTSLMRLMAGLDRPTGGASGSTVAASSARRCRGAASPWSTSSSSTIPR